MTTAGEIGYRKARTEYIGRIPETKNLPSDSHISALSPSEVDTLNRIDAAGINPYNVDTTLTIEEYSVQQYIARTLSEGKKPNPKVIKALTKD